MVADNPQIGDTWRVKRAEPSWQPKGALVAMLDASPVRTAVLGYLARHEGALRSDICADLGLSLATFWSHINVLIELGAVRTDPPVVTRGVTAYYYLNREAVVAELDSYRALILGYDVGDDA